MGFKLFLLQWQQKPIIGGIIAGMLLASCTTTQSAGGRNGNSDNANKPASITITVGKAEERDVASVIEATGSLIGDETTNVAPMLREKFRMFT